MNDDRDSHILMVGDSAQKTVVVPEPVEPEPNRGG